MLSMKLQVILLAFDAFGVTAAMEVEDDIIHPGTGGFLIGHGMYHGAGIDDAFTLMGLRIGLWFFSIICMCHVGYLTRNK